MLAWSYQLDCLTLSCPTDAPVRASHAEQVECEVQTKSDHLFLYYFLSSGSFVLSSAPHKAFCATVFFLCGHLKIRCVCRAVRPVSGEDGILEAETSDVAAALHANMLLWPRLLLDWRSEWPSLINRLVVHCPSIARRLRLGSNGAGS